MTTPAINGSTVPPRPRKRIEPPRPEKAETYHGLPVLGLRVDDPIPTPAAPARYAVRVYPDLARYLLTFNHPDNRRRKPRGVRKYAEDMRRGLWRLTPQGPVFSRSGVLQNGQNSLAAVEEFGGEVWMVFDFGWPDETIYVIDRGAARSLSDSLHIDGAHNANILAAAVSKWWQYQCLVGKRRSISGFDVPSHEVARGIIAAAPETWAEAATIGRRIHAQLDGAWGDSQWAAAFAIIVTAGVSLDVVRAFYEEVGEGTGQPRSATRDLGDFSRRRRTGDVRSGDAREPIELIIRAFNAWRAGRRLALVKHPGFEWSRVRP